MWEEIISQYLIPALALLVSALFTWLGVKLRSLINKQKAKIESDEINNIIDKVVMYVEQTSKDMTSSEKLNKALSSASLWLYEKGIKVTEEQLKILVESAVNNFYGKE